MMKYLVANWKMNLGIKESSDLTKKFVDELKPKKDLTIIICPSFTALTEVKKNITKSDIILGAQDISWEDKGAMTGEVSGKELKEIGVTYVIIGHSERRHIIGESDEIIAKKLKKTLDFGLHPILCVGETLLERNDEQAEKIVARQLEIGLKLINSSQINKVLIAYEPVWAIGTNNPCQPNDALSMMIIVRKTLVNIFGEIEVPVLYGGSTDDRNLSDYIQVGYSGALVGGSSLHFMTFLKMHDLI